ncbi:MAG: hypothetical protein JSR66_09855 [Proteobacteria bacterium]|nr:hypothetical protein [Pseudomonadota bacterium]
MLSHQTLKIVADSVNPTLGLLALALPFATWRGQWRSPAKHIAVTLLTVALTYLLRAAFGFEAVWAHWGMDFSTHGAICIVLSVALASLCWRRSWIWGAVFVGYDFLMVYQAYHTWVDIGTTAAVILPFALLLRYWGDRWVAGSLGTRAPSSS